MKHRSKTLLFSLCVLLQAACSTNAVYTDESFAYDSLFKLRTDGDAAMACESARRSLLGQGYIIETTSSEGVKARKAYKSESSQNTFIEMNVVCLPETTGSTVFATGKSITNRSSRTNIGELMLQYQGGGHENAGTCQIGNDQADRVLGELITRINADG